MKALLERGLGALPWRAEPRVETRPDRSPLLRRLLENLEGISERLSEPDLWLGWRVSNPESGPMYTRLVCKQQLVSLGPAPREYVVGVHAFPGREEPGQMHNHRFPLAVLPLSPEGSPGEALYRMPWEVRRGARARGGGTLVVRSGAAYALEECLTLFHAVHSVRPHLSINLADVTDPPARENRLQAEAVAADRVVEVLAQVAAAARQGGGESCP